MSTPTPLHNWRPIEEAPDHVEVITYCPTKCEGYRQTTLNMRVGDRWVRSHERHPPTLFIPLPPVPASTIPLEIAA